MRLPEVLERDALLMPQGQAGLEALQGHRWAEPLRDAVPRLLRQDLATLLGEARVWSAPISTTTGPMHLQPAPCPANPEPPGCSARAGRAASCMWVC